MVLNGKNKTIYSGVLLKVSIIAHMETMTTDTTNLDLSVVPLSQHQQIQMVCRYDLCLQKPGATAAWDSVAQCSLQYGYFYCLFKIHK